MKEKHELTQEGYEEIIAIHDYLINVGRPEIIKAIQEARAQGDLSENADYDAAKNKQAAIEAEIIELEDIIKNHVIIEKTKENIVAAGKIVTIKFDDKDEEESYEIVGELESDPFENKISKQSPLCKAIAGKRKGDEVDFVSHNEIIQRVTIMDVKDAK